MLSGAKSGEDSGVTRSRGQSFPSISRGASPLPSPSEPASISRPPASLLPPPYAFLPCLNIQIGVGRVAGVLVVVAINDLLVAWTGLITLPPLVLSNPSGTQTVSH